VLDRPNSYFIIARTVQHHKAVLYRTQIAFHPKKSHFTYLGDVEMWIFFFFFRYTAESVYVLTKRNVFHNLIFVQIIFTFSQRVPQNLNAQHHRGIVTGGIYEDRELDQLTAEISRESVRGQRPV
jgi:hypothetical protein